MEIILAAFLSGLAGLLPALGVFYMNWRNGQKTVAETDSVEMETITKASVSTVELIQSVMKATVDPLKERLVHAEEEIKRLRVTVREQESLLEKVQILAETYRMGIILLTNQIVELGHTPVFFLEEAHERTVHTSETQRTISSTVVRQSGETPRNGGDV